MQNDYSIFKIPSTKKEPVHNFAETKADFEYFFELNQIAEEIEKCRQRNLL